MSEFRRMITYLYLYEQGAKRHNVGFAKIEKRGKSCLIEIHMKNTGHSTPSIPVYFYARNNQRLPGILIGSMGISRGTGDFKAVLEEEPFAGTVYCLEDIKGIFLPLSDEVMFVSQWDDNEFVREQFVDLAKEAAAQKETGKERQGGTAGRRSSQQAPQTGRHPRQQASYPRRSAPQQGNPASSHSQPHTNREPSLQAASAGNPPTQETGTGSKGSLQQDMAASSLPAAQPSALKSSGVSNPSVSDGSNAPSPSVSGNTSAHHLSASGGSNKPSLSAPDGSNAPNPSASNGSSAPSPSASRSSSAPSSSAPAEPAAPDSPSDLKAAEAVPKIMPSGGKGTPFPAQPEQQAEGLPENWEQKWNFILENYPVMTPFAGDEDTICVRLELKDIRLLPRPYWYLGNNSFLLHGFFNYRYLILGATKKASKKRWFLGIPGIYQNPERVMATLFGFPEFRNEKSAPINTGEFGYWYRYLN